MRITECYIESFGKLSSYTVSFTDGLNSTLAENGWGKSTLCAFIRAMFYGLGQERRQSLDENDRKKYYPWQGGRFGGSLTFTVGNEKYRIERSFGKKSADDTFTLIDVKTGKASDKYSESIGFELFGIDAAGFERTIFISEKSIRGAINNDTIAAKLSDLVGTDGDVGAVSDAIERLEERRKYYQKRGNSGEIANLRAKISECDSALDNLERRRLEAEAKEAELSELSREIAGLEKESRALGLKLEEEHRGAEKRSHREQYSRLLGQLEQEREQYAALSEYFRAGVPTAYEIDDARDAARELARLKEMRSSTGSERLAELSEFFSHATDISDITDAKLNRERAQSARLEAEAIEKNVDFMQSTFRDELGGEIPEAKTLEAGIESLKRGAIPIPSIAAAILAILSLIPAFLISPLFFLVSAVLFAISIPFAISRDRKRKAALASLGKFGADIRSLEKLLSHVRMHEESIAKSRERQGELTREAESLEERIKEFLSHYPALGEDIFDAVLQLERLFKEYYTLKLAKEARAADDRELDMRIAFLSDKERAFREKYKSDSQDPFEEVRSRLNSYNYAGMLVKKREEELRVFRITYSISEDEALPEISADNAANIERELSECGDKLIAARRAHALAEREYANLLADVERIDEVRSIREQLTEKLARYSENLNIILKTAEMLTEASNAMTSRYIGGTKAKLREYASEIGSTPLEIALSTDFVPKIFDRGETRSEESYSRGMRDVYAFALRLALSESLWEGELPFIVMDDPFTALDGERLERAKALVRRIAEEKQIIYFTCSRERAM